MKRFAFGWFVAFALAGCTGQVIGGGTGASTGGAQSGGTGGVHQGGNGGAGGSVGNAGCGADGCGGTTYNPGTGLPQCAVMTNEPGPYQVNLLFENSTGGTLYLHEDCDPSFEIYECNQGYTLPLQVSGAECTALCSDPSPCQENCNDCMMASSIAVPSNGSFGVKWDGTTFTIGTLANGCFCHTADVAPSGKYRVKVPVYLTAQDAESFQSPSEVEVDFDLPTAGGVVHVPLTHP